MLWKQLKRKMKKYSKQMICEDVAEITYKEAIEFSENFAKKLKGIKCCAILCDSELATSLVLLSCFAANVTALPLSKRYGELHCNKILDSISPDAVVTDENGILNVNRIKNSNFKKPKVKPAIIMCTSGTSGTPKGAMLTELNILTNVNDISLYFKINENDSILISRPIYHCAVLTGEFLTSLFKGVKIHFYSGTFNPTLVLKLIEKNSITVFGGTPTLLSMMSRFKRNENLLKHICISGECMDKMTGEFIFENFPKANIYNVYGLTEACPRISYLPPHLFPKYADSVGIPLESVSLKIINEDGKEARLNEIGVLWVKGNNVMSGYYNDPQKTKEVLKEGWLCTGDLALIDDNGLLKIKGRNDDMIIKGGMNIYPQEIESALKKDPRVKEVLITSENDKRLGVQIVLNIVGNFKNSSEVKQFCKEYLPSYQIPSKINLVESLAKNGSGKIIRR